MAGVWSIPSPEAAKPNSSSGGPRAGWTSGGQRATSGQGRIGRRLGSRLRDRETQQDEEYQRGSHGTRHTITPARR